MFHKHTMNVALAGLASILIYKISFDTDFHFSGHLLGSSNKEGEWMILLNLLGLLLGFAILANHFERSGIPQILPNYLPNDWKGGFVLLIMIFVLSSFLDNIAAALIGGAIAHVVFKKKVHIGYLVAIVAASNGGGSGSVLGDTTTTMMWIDGVSAIDVLHAYAAAIPALLIFGVFASVQQDKYHRITKSTSAKIKVDWKKISVVFLILGGAILANIYFSFPAIGVWAAILIGSFITHTPWEEARKSVKGTIFLLSLVLSASMMPVNELPLPSWESTFALGFISAVFDNIPLTKLALEQGQGLSDVLNYDWGLLAYSVGFGGSMIWFGSSAGVALSNLYPEAKSVWSWVKGGWHVILAYIIGFFFAFYVLGWNPHHPTKNENINSTNSDVKSKIELYSF